MALFDEDAFFQHWHGASIQGKRSLYRAWAPWLKNHGGFRLTTEDLFVDEEAQKVLYRRQLDWPSLEKGLEGKPEKRRGVDVIQFRDGKIIQETTYSETTVEIDAAKIWLARSKERR